ncbi:MAG: hypothetical protein CM15mP125_1970 [Gammaproteobacteria bacterium]|nr:MAG: hypothetical protein CM15mP125_1970 [Gammaproteobacteria bacterium]
MVVEEAFERSETDLDTTFWVTDYEAQCRCAKRILPDLFAEGEGVVAEAPDEPGCWWPHRCLPSTMRTICLQRWLPHSRARRRRKVNPFLP